MPWFTGGDITDAMYTFWRYIYSVEFRADLHKLHPDLKVRLTDISVSGDSAGAWLAMYSYLTALKPNPELGQEDLLPIRVVYLQYPMLRHYKRDRPAEGWNYLDHLLDDDVHAEYGQKLEEAWKEWRSTLVEEDEIPHNIDIRRPWAPLGMSAGNLSSSYNNLWEDMFRNNNPHMDDIIQRLEKVEARVPRVQVTDFYIYHGKQDVNCKVEESRTAKRLLMEKCGVKEENVHLWEMEGLAHGFDHNMSVKDGKFLEQIYREIEAILSP
jgi:hypothetical protein